MKVPVPPVYEYTHQLKEDYCVAKATFLEAQMTRVFLRHFGQIPVHDIEMIKRDLDHDPDVRKRFYKLYQQNKAASYVQRAINDPDFVEDYCVAKASGVQRDMEMVMYRYFGTILPDDQYRLTCALDREENVRKRVYDLYQQNKAL
jgi:hypothetical protein